MTTGETIWSVGGVDWLIEPAPLDYAVAVARMEGWVDSIASGVMRERVWLLEHNPVITAGTSATADELLDGERFPVVAAGRGGRYTHHAPGQRIAYVMLDLRHRGRDVRAFVRQLEAWVVASLGLLGIEAFTDDAGTGVWTRKGGRIAKVGAIGLRVRRWISFHGVSINVTNDLSGFDAIVPCGIRDHGVTRLTDLERNGTMAALDEALAESFPTVFGSGQVKRAVPA